MQFDIAWAAVPNLQTRIGTKYENNSEKYLTLGNRGPKEIIFLCFINSYVDCFKTVQTSRSSRLLNVENPKLNYCYLVT